MTIVRMWRRLRGVRVRLGSRSSSYGNMVGLESTQGRCPNREGATHYGLLPDIIIPVHKDVSPHDNCQFNFISLQALLVFLSIHR